MKRLEPSSRGISARANETQATPLRDIHCRLGARGCQRPPAEVMVSGTEWAEGALLRRECLVGRLECGKNDASDPRNHPMLLHRDPIWNLRFQQQEHNFLSRKISPLFHPSERPAFRSLSGFH